MQVLCIIPARSGSKTIRHKNIQSYHGKPLMAHSILQAKEAETIDRVLLSTDDEYYAEIGRSFGAETPFLRPDEISGDHATDLEVFVHALNYLKEHESYNPDIIVQLRPTYPNRRVSDIDAMVNILKLDQSLDSVRSVSQSRMTPYKVWFKNEAQILQPILQLDHIREPYNSPRQILPKTYDQNASIDVMRRTTIMEKNSMTGDKIYGYEMEDFYDIDTAEEFQSSASDAMSNELKTYCFDIDGVIAYLSPDKNYELAKPNESTIRKVNALYEAGHKIILFTARGTVTGKNWEKLTEQQMKDWNVQYHTLLFGKPDADYYIDDKNLFLKDILK